MTIRFGILGVGRIGQVHGSAIAAVAGASLVAVSDPVIEAAQAMAKIHGCAIRSIDEIASSGDIDAVIICTPTDTHADLIETFCKAGKAVFCEKPIDLDLTRVRACLSVVEKTNGTLMVGFQRRFDPDFGALKLAIMEGRIGEVETVNLVSRDPGPPPADYIARSGGIFKDMAIHDIDVARWLLEDDDVETVQAVASNLVDPEIGKLGDFDTAAILLRTKSGKQATINCSRRATYGYDQRIEVHGSKGGISAQNTHAARIEISDSAGYHRPPLQDFFMSRYAAAYSAEIASFVDCLEKNQSLKTSGTDGYLALAIAEAALLSVKEERVVRLADIIA